MRADTGSTWKPSATVAAVIEQDNRFLIVEEPRDGKIVFNQPAGHLDPGESLLEAVIREVKEETAWDFTPEFVTGIYQWENIDNGKTYMRTTFTGTVDNHDPNQTLYDGILCASWKTHAELIQSADKLRSPMVLKCIEDYLAGARFPIDLLHHIPS
ncbi:MAG: NUDIX hydrolase [Pseudomonadota bacterium]